MKEVKMLVSMAGPDESWQPGDNRVVEDGVADDWERLGIATIIPSDAVVVEEEGAQPKAKRGRKAKK